MNAYMDKALSPDGEHCSSALQVSEDTTEGDDDDDDDELILSMMEAP